MVIAGAIHVDGKGIDARLGHFMGNSAVKGDTIGHQSPHEAAFTDGTPAVHQVWTYQRLAAHGVHQHLSGVAVCRHIVEHGQEVG